MLLRSFTWCVTLLFTLTATLASAQVPVKNPIVDASQSIGANGISEKNGTSASLLKFNRGPRKFVKTYVASMFDDAELQKAMEALLNEFMDNYEAASKGQPFENDGAYSLGFAVALLEAVTKGKSPEEAAIQLVSEKLRATLDKPEVREATNAQKQEFYEWTLCAAGMVIALSQAEGEDAKTKIPQLAEAHLQLLIGASSKALTITSQSVKLTPTGRATGESGPGSGALAAGFTFSSPEGWTQSGGWYMRPSKSRPEDTAVTTALMRFPAPIPAKGNMGDALRTVWDTELPPEAKGKGSGMVFRRYVGDQLFAQFIFGRARDKGAQADTLYTVFLIDCGATWQPVISAVTYHDTGTFQSGVDFSAQYNYPTGVDMAEKFLATFKCPPAKGRPLADKDVLVGDYTYGASSSLQWENIYTGASSMTFVSYGGTLNLKADGTFAYTFSSASGQVGAAKFSGAKGAGKWSIQGDILTCKYSSYDQGDSYKRDESKYRIAGVVIFPDGTKVVVLKSRLDLPINAITVGDSSDYYSTKKM